MNVVLDEGFSVADAAPFTATIDEILDSPFGYVQDDTPEDRTDYGVELFLDLGNMALTDTDSLDICAGWRSPERARSWHRSTATHSTV